MFYVFGINGPMYQGGPERLSHITAVRGVPRPAALRPGASGVEGDEAQSRQLPAAPARHQGALAAYRSTEEGPKQERQPLELVRDVMTRGALTVNPRDTVGQAWALLSKHHIAQAPVLDDAQRVVGLLLRADIAPLELLPAPGERRQSHAVAHRPVSELMVTPVPAVSEDTPLRRVATVLLESGLPGLPVTNEHGALSGFLSRTDILRAVAADPPLDLWG